MSEIPVTYGGCDIVTVPYPVCIDKTKWNKPFYFLDDSITLEVSKFRLEIHHWCQQNLKHEFALLKNTSEGIQVAITDGADYLYFCMKWI